MSSTRTVLDRVLDVLRKVVAPDVVVLGSDVAHGGCINESTVLSTNHGRFFVKTHPSAPDRMFSSEAKGLSLLRQSGTRLRIPEVLGAEDSTLHAPGFIVMEHLASGPAISDFDAELGVGLAELHASSASRFGADFDNYCGLTPQKNPWTSNWVAFYRDHRLRFQLKRARNAGHFDRKATALFETLLNRLDDLLGGDDDVPALIHGDLWSGNLVNASGQPALVDPAAYFGHREAEFGMMTLFGGFGPAVFDAYEGHTPLAPGWRDRLPLYQLYHVMNHANLFGGHYASQAIEIVRRFV